ncbi:MAG: lysophospholipase [Candidatus Obscuribacterales bacterium]|nr:lysophospholipase [Candidatus Obscuribacterales bacterium]
MSLAGQKQSSAGSCGGSSRNHTTRRQLCFGTLAQHLASQGFVFIGLDLRGHGERFYKAFAGQPNHRVDYDKSADDLGTLLTKVHATYPNLPVFCLGESVGAAVATHCAGRHKGLMDGIILCSPGTRPRVFNPFMVVPDFIKGITHLDIPMDVSKYIDHYSSDDKRVSDEMIADPLSRIKMTPKEILRTAFFIRTTPEAAKEVAPDVPVLIVQGELDGIVSKKSTNAILKNLPGDNKQLVEFKDAGHVLLGTSYLKPQVVDSVTKWLTEQTAANRTKVIGLHQNQKVSTHQ